LAKGNVFGDVQTVPMYASHYAAFRDYSSHRYYASCVDSPHFLATVHVWVLVVTFELRYVGLSETFVAIRSIIMDMGLTPAFDHSIGNTIHTSPLSSST